MTQICVLNIQLKNIIFHCQWRTYEWFNANKLSFNADKTKYSLFYKPSKTDNLPLLLPKLLINDNKVERVGSIKFLEVLLDEHLSWKEHIRYIENKVGKGIGLLYKAKLFLVNTVLFIHSNLLKLHKFVTD